MDNLPDPVATEVTPKKKRRIKSMKELASKQDFDVEFEMNGEIAIIGMTRISYSRWKELEESVPVVEPPRRVEGRKTVADVQNEEYKAKKNARLDRIGVLRVAASITDSIPGKTIEAKADWLEGNMDIGFLQGVYRWLVTLHSEGLEAFSLADTFHGDGS